jgi:CNT family concentrative nucleoside transporter
MMNQLISFLGVWVLIGFALLLSRNRTKISWRTIIGGIAIQFVIGALLFLFEPGRKVFLVINDVVYELLGHARSGAYLIFGALAVPPGETGQDGEASMGFFLAFQGLPTIIFFSALMALLYHIGVMPIILRFFSRVFSRTMRLSGAESLCSASNIFVGIESLFSIRPYLQKMTSSEFALILTAGMATIASSVLGLYVILLKGTFPTIAGHLVSASLLSAPAAVVMAKILIPETQKPETTGKVVSGVGVKANSSVEAVLKGAQEGLKLTLGIVALLIAFLGLVSLANGIIGGGTALLGKTGLHFTLSLEKMLGWIFYPFTVLIGVGLRDAGAIAQILGERTVLTEVASYKHLAGLIESGALTDMRSAVIAAYGLCGFAHVAAVAIFVGGAAALVPERAADISRLGFRALIAATLACFQTAAVAGVFVSAGGGILFGS